MLRRARRSEPEACLFERMSAAALVALLAWGTLTIWVPQRWPLSLMHAGVLALAAGWAGRAALRGVTPVLSFPVIAVGAAVVWAACLTFSGSSVYLADSKNALAHWMVSWAILAVATQLFVHARLRTWFLGGLLYFGAVVTVIAVIQYCGGNGRVFWLFPYRYSDTLGPFQNRNNFAAFVELLTPLALWEAFREKHDRLLHLGLTGLFVAAVVVASSRAGTVLVVLEVIAVLLLLRARGILAGDTLTRTAAWTSGLAVFFVLVFGWEGLSRRFQQRDPFVYRLEILESSLAMVANRPWTGFGPGTFQTVYPAFAVFDTGLVVNHAHNEWVEWAAEGGAPFALILVAVAVWSLGPAIRSIWGLGIVAVFVHAMVDYPLQRLGVAGWVLVLLAAVAAQNANGESVRGAHPLMTPIGRRRATLRASPARSTTSITSSTSL